MFCSYENDATGRNRWNNMRARVTWLLLLDLPEVKPSKRKIYAPSTRNCPAVSLLDSWNRIISLVNYISYFLSPLCKSIFNFRGASFEKYQHVKRLLRRPIDAASAWFEVDANNKRSSVWRSNVTPSTCP